MAVDQGTHASRAILFDSLGRPIAHALQNIGIRRFHNGRVEQDPWELVHSVQQVIHKIITASQAPISACGIATQRSTVLAWARDGRPVSSALSWQDVRGMPLVEGLQSHKAEISKISGLPLSPHYGASKLHWLQQWLKTSSNIPGELRLSPLASFLLFHLLDTRPFKTDHGNAQRTQLMDLATLNWSPQLLEWFQVPLHCLPQCTPICGNFGLLKDTAIPVLAVNGDQNAAFFGAGQLESDSALINLGSGAFILREIGFRPRPSQTQVTGIAFSDHQQTLYLREATVNGAGNALNWARTKWGIENLYQQLPAWLEHTTHPPIFINTIGGLGSPWWRQDIAPRFVGEAPNISIEKRIVAIVESIGFMIQANLELMHQQSPLSKLYVSGGLANLNGLCQQLANLSHLTVARLKAPETTARGIAWLAAGRPENWKTSTPIDLFTPRPDPGLESRYSQFRHFLKQYLAE